MKHHSAKSFVLSAIALATIAAVTQFISSKLPYSDSSLRLIMPLLPYLAGTILGGYISVKVFKISWHDLVNLVAALAAAVAAYIAFRTEGIVLSEQLKTFIIYLLAASGGVFILPLFIYCTSVKNPKGYKSMGLTLLITTLLLLIVDLYFGQLFGSSLGLLTLILGNLLGAIAIGLGLLINLLRQPARAAWVGSLGISLCITCYLAWVFFGTPWFP